MIRARLVSMETLLRSKLIKWGQFAQFLDSKKQCTALMAWCLDQVQLNAQTENRDYYDPRCHRRNFRLCPVFFESKKRDKQTLTQIPKRAT
jgi:hypothetical protein